MTIASWSLGAYSVPPWCLLGASLVPPRCLPGASLHPLTWSQVFGVILCPLPSPKDQHESLQTHFGATLGPLEAHFGHMRVAVKDFGITLSLLWGHFQANLSLWSTLRSPWCHFRALWGYFGHVWITLWCYFGHLRFSKNTHCRHWSVQI